MVTDFLKEHDIEIAYDCTFNLYLPKKEDFSSRIKYNFPVVAISLSDYNIIRKMLGYVVLLVVFNFDVICPKKNRFSPLYLCSGDFSFHITIKLLAFSEYNDVYDEKELPRDNYEMVTDFLKEHDIEIAYDCTFNLYLPKKED